MVLMDHHAIGDGLSLTVFHRTLWKYLQESSRSSSTSESREQEWPYIVPSDLKPPVFIEDAIKIPKDVVPLLTTEAASPFKPWVGNPPRLAPKMTRVHITTIPLAHLAVVTEYLSTDLQGVSLTGYLHSLMLIHLSRHIPSATCFRGETPFSLRRFALTGSEEMVNHISCIDNDWAPDLVASIRDSWPERESEIIKAVYAVYRRQLKAELRTVDQSGPSFLREVLAIADLERYCEESLTRERGHTYELSNVGVSDMDVEGTALDAAPELSVEKLVFTQCAMVTGPAFGCNVTMVKDGPLTVTLTWQDGIIDEGLLRGCGRFIADAFEERYRASI
ncbi:hypothetical protein PVAG01_05618 [Phlyctema vagabunda]|uniref:Alcohol acetyltransferase n=1 Tax=Phlyctema vagabunda TaxID=108571 RepID=A0ABR4PKK1_9HELO